MTKKAQPKTCFVISPIGKEGSDENRLASWFLESIVNPVLVDKFSYEVIRADQIPKPGMVDSQIIELLMDSNLAIADLTFLNPNVFYEIGIRHAFYKPVIHLARKGQVLPFDNTLVRTIFYDIKLPKDIEVAKNNLSKAVKALEESDFTADNPVTRTRGRQEAESESTPINKQILETINRFGDRLQMLENVVENQQMASSYNPTLTAAPNYLAQGLLNPTYETPTFVIDPKTGYLIPSEPKNIPQTTDEIVEQLVRENEEKRQAIIASLENLEQAGEDEKNLVKKPKKKPKE